MHFSSALVATAAFAGYASAQMATVIPVQVASTNGTFRFFPEKVTAEPGSYIQFQFMGGNHTVTQSTFDNPCVPINDVNPDAAPGVSSGYIPVDASANMGQRPLFNILVNDTTPMWLYCAQGPHCINGMSMVINENTAGNETRSLENYKASASTLTPGNGGAAPPAPEDPANPANPADPTNPEQPDAGNGGNNGGEAPADGTEGEDGTVTNPGQGGAEQGEEDDFQPSAASSLTFPTTLLLAVGAAFMLA